MGVFLQSSFAAAAVHFISRPPLFLSSSERAASERISVCQRRRIPRQDWRGARPRPTAANARPRPSDEMRRRGNQIEENISWNNAELLQYSSRQLVGYNIARDMEYLVYLLWKYPQFEHGRVVPCPQFSRTPRATCNQFIISFDAAMLLRK